MKHKKLFYAALIVSAALFVTFAVRLISNGGSEAKNTNQTSDLSFDSTRYSLTEPNSIWVVVNKQNQLNPKDFTPDGLITPNVALRVPGNDSMQVGPVTATAIEEMFTAAKAEGINLMLASGYRSYKYQVGLYNGYVKTQGQAEADKQSARPGYSEHQTGLAADIEPVNKQCELELCFADTPEGKWLANNAYKYGFVIRYAKDKTAITGYEYEPWHVRYVGTMLSTEMHNRGVQTLEEFFNLPPAPNY